MFTAITQIAARTKTKDNPFTSILHQIVRARPVKFPIPFILTSNKTIHIPATIFLNHGTSLDGNRSAALHCPVSDESTCLGRSSSLCKLPTSNRIDSYIFR